MSFGKMESIIGIRTLYAKRSRIKYDFNLNQKRIKLFVGEFLFSDNTLKMRFNRFDISLTEVVDMRGRSSVGMPYDV